ncbi:MAG: FAD-dependent oxidoreductase [Nitrospinota bacterium]
MKALFSTWKGIVVDNRGKPQDQWVECENVYLSESLGEGRRMASFMGWDGVVILGEPYDIVQMAWNYAKALQESSCAQCFPCRVGTKAMEDLLAGIVAGRGTEKDIDELSGLCETISKTSKCGIGQLGPEPILHTIEHFRQDYIEYVSGNAKSQNGISYPYKMTAPCTAACPTGMDVPLYIEQIKQGDFAGSLETIRQASPMASTLGRACFHPCENNCRRENVERSLSICKLKRFAWDYEDRHDVKKPENPDRHARPEKVAVIGGGPAGLSCAYYLALMGYRPTVFEKLSVLGGAAHTGIPQYRIPKEILTVEADYLRGIGVELRTGVHFGKDETFDTLRSDGFKAFFLATGADLSKGARVKGENAGHKGFYAGISILKDVVFNNGKMDNVPEKVLVIGGGNTAMDCVRTFVRLGCKDVNIVYRRTIKEMPADPHEIHEAQEEGVKLNFLLAPTQVIAKRKKVVGLECQKMELGPPDDSGRRRPVAIEGSEHVIECDCIISAIGQDADLFYLEEEQDVKKTKWKTAIVNEDTHQTDVPDIFAGGDMVDGPLTLVAACGQARRAAQGIDQYIRGEKVQISDAQIVDKAINQIGAYDPDEVVPEVKGWQRKEMPICDIKLKNGSFTEVELGYPPEDAMEEAARCMRCYIVGMAGIVENGS